MKGGDQRQPGSEEWPARVRGGRGCNPCGRGPKYSFQSMTRTREQPCRKDSHDQPYVRECRAEAGGFAAVRRIGPGETPALCSFTTDAGPKAFCPLPTRAAVRVPRVNAGTPEQLGAYLIVRAEQARTRKGDFCRRPSCSHPRGSHRAGIEECEFAVVCACHTFVGRSPAPQHGSKRGHT